MRISWLQLRRVRYAAKRASDALDADPTPTEKRPPSWTDNWEEVSDGTDATSWQKSSVHYSYEKCRLQQVQTAISWSTTLMPPKKVWWGTKSHGMSVAETENWWTEAARSEWWRENVIISKICADCGRSAQMCCVFGRSVQICLVFSKCT